MYDVQTTADTNLRGVSPDSEEVAEKNAVLNKKKKDDKKLTKMDDKKEKVEEKPLDRPTEEGMVNVNLRRLYLLQLHLRMLEFLLWYLIFQKLQKAKKKVKSHQEKGKIRMMRMMQTVELIKI